MKFYSYVIKNSILGQDDMSWRSPGIDRLTNFAYGEQTCLGITNHDSNIMIENYLYDCF